jgi:putative transposase
MDPTAHRRPTPPRVHRNSVWHIDQAQVPLTVEFDGVRLRPWVIWIVDEATHVIMGWTLTPGLPQRVHVLAALRMALRHHQPYDPVGGIPERIRADHGPLLTQLTDVMSAAHLNVHVERPQPCAPVVKAMTEMFHTTMCRTEPTPTSPDTARPGTGPTEPGVAVLSWPQAVDAVHTWRNAWNRETPQAQLGDRTPLQAWQDDDTRLVDTETDSLRSLLLGTGGERVITAAGVTWHRRQYLAPWMDGQTGTRVRVRYAPGDDQEIVLYSSSTGAYLGPAVLNFDAARTHDDVPWPRWGEQDANAGTRQQRALRHRRHARGDTPEPL